MWFSRFGVSLWQTVRYRRGLPGFYNVRTVPFTEYDRNAVCSICLDTIKNDGCSVADCEHTFHRRCLKQWTAQNRSCPMCRGPS